MDIPLVLSMPTGFLSLSNEIKYKIFDELILIDYDQYDDSPARSAAFGRSTFRSYTFSKIVQAVPALYQICDQYTYQWPSRGESVYEVLQKVVIERPELSRVVRGLDLRSAVYQRGDENSCWPTREKAHNLLKIAEETGYSTLGFDLEQLSDWIGLAFHLLPHLRTLLLSDHLIAGPGGCWSSSVTKPLVNRKHSLGNIHHIALDVRDYHGLYKDETSVVDVNIAVVLSDLLDFPSIKSLKLAHFSRGSRRTLNRDIEDPEKHGPSTCTHFEFRSCFITAYELLMIGARCKPRVLILSPGDPGDAQSELDEDSDEDDDEEDIQNYGEALNMLCYIPEFIEHLEELEIKDSHKEVDYDNPRVFPLDPLIPLSSFQKLHTLSIPIHTITGADPFSIMVIDALPPSLENLTLESSTYRFTATQWQSGDYLNQVQVIFRRIPKRLPKLKMFRVDMPTLVSDDIFNEGRVVFKGIGNGMETGRLYTVLRLARKHRVVVVDCWSGEEVPTKAGTFELWGHDDEIWVEFEIKENGKLVQIFDY